jgi:peptidoglycan/LPS O-acetylase OafA/YrhL
MGLLRTFLALSVLFVHAGAPFGLRGLPGDMALQTFFLISGFYMTLVLSDRYAGPGGLLNFARNRALRLFPIYWVVAVITLVYVASSSFDCAGLALQDHCFIDYNMVERYARLDPGPRAFLAISNLVLLGQDATLFLALNADQASLSFATDFRESIVPVHAFLLVPPAWSLSVELMFYLVAPLLVRQKVVIVAVVLLASLLLRFAIYRIVGGHDPWSYRFFPTELALFALGILSCKAYLGAARQAPSAPAWAITALFLAVSFAWPWWHLPGGKWTYFGLATAALPFVFRATRASKADSMIGDLSYPLYVVHILVIAAVIPLIAGTSWETRLSAIAVPMSLLAAGLLWLLVGRPIEMWRHAEPSGRS